MLSFNWSPDKNRDGVGVVDFRCVGSGDFELCVDAMLGDVERFFLFASSFDGCDKIDDID